MRSPLCLRELRFSPGDVLVWGATPRLAGHEIRARLRDLRCHLLEQIWFTGPLAGRTAHLPRLPVLLTEWSAILTIIKVGRIKGARTTASADERFIFRFLEAHRVQGSIQP